MTDRLHPLPVSSSVLQLLEPWESSSNFLIPRAGMGSAGFRTPTSLPGPLHSHDGTAQTEQFCWGLESTTGKGGIRKASSGGRNFWL